MMIVSDHSMSDTPQLAKISLASILGSAGVPDDAYTIVGNSTAAHIYLNDRTDPAPLRAAEADARGARRRARRSSTRVYQNAESDRRRRGAH